MNTSIGNLLRAFLLALLALSTNTFGQGSCPAIPADGPIVVFDDKIEPGWNTEWSWGNTQPMSSWIIQDTAIVGKSGLAALKAVFTATTGGGLEFHTDPIYTPSTNGHKAVTFMFRQEMEGNSYIGVRNTATNSVPTFALLNNYIAPKVPSTGLTPGKWYVMSVPLSVLQATNTLIGGIVFYTDAPGTIYVDKVEITDGFLAFPLACSDATCSTGSTDYRIDGAYTRNAVISVVDHQMTAVYSDKDGVLIPFTGETFRATPDYPSTGKVQCYPKENNAAWSQTLTELYRGTTGSGALNCADGVALNYEAHPGYDYQAAIGTPVKAAAGGTVVSFTGSTVFGTQRCIPKGMETPGCAHYGAVGIDHGNGFITQYLHLSRIDIIPGDPVYEGQQIGLSGEKGSEGSPHLHFEVLKINTGSDPTKVTSYKVMDPYGWYADGKPDDPLANVTGYRNVRLWK